MVCLRLVESIQCIDFADVIWQPARRKLAWVMEFADGLAATPGMVSALALVDTGDGALQPVARSHQPVRIDFAGLPWGGSQGSRALCRGLVCGLAFDPPGPTWAP